jgi:hypothetical protein
LIINLQMFGWHWPPEPSSDSICLGADDSHLNTAAADGINPTQALWFLRKSRQSVHIQYAK